MIPVRVFLGFSICRRHNAVNGIEVRIQDRGKVSGLLCRKTGWEITGNHDFSDIRSVPRSILPGFRMFPASQHQKGLFALSCHPFDHTAHKRPFKSGESETRGDDQVC